VTAASEPDILAGVERWARVRGFAPDRLHEAAWSCFTNVLDEVTIRAVGTVLQWAVSPALALAWALTVETDAAPVDVGRCPACRGRGTVWWDGEDAHPPGRVICEGCGGRTRKAIPAARLLLDATTGDTRALEHLPKHADRLAFAGDPLGEVLSLALGPWTVPVAPANGLGYPYLDKSGTAAALAWLTRLTDEREPRAKLNYRT
jgi:hypothetical protein